ncbi:MAG: hypothetical protein JRE71_19725 [Deltaproteobacteria bacterium]|nr:hypothetical protein [Deltaproteobacteria bacterium]
MNLHFHSIFLDGVYTDPDNTEKPVFFPLPPPDDESQTWVMPPRTRCKTKSRYSPLVPQHHSSIGLQQVIALVSPSCASVIGSKQKMSSSLQGNPAPTCRASVFTLASQSTPTTARDLND